MISSIVFACVCLCVDMLFIVGLLVISSIVKLWCVAYCFVSVWFLCRCYVLGLLVFSLLGLLLLLIR